LEDDESELKLYRRAQIRKLYQTLEDDES